MSENTRYSVRQQIDENLRRVYQEKVEEDVPDRFADLLRRLQDQDESVPSSVSSPDHDKGGGK